jgi:hypothetical protein
VTSSQRNYPLREDLVDVNDLILDSIDDHVIEPRNLFDIHVPEKYKADAPKSIVDENGLEK